MSSISKSLLFQKSDWWTWSDKPVANVMIFSVEYPPKLHHNFELHLVTIDVNVVVCDNQQELLNMTAQDHRCWELFCFCHAVRRKFLRIAFFLESWIHTVGNYLLFWSFGCKEVVVNRNVWMFVEKCKWLLLIVSWGCSSFVELQFHDSAIPLNQKLGSS